MSFTKFRFTLSNFYAASVKVWRRDSTCGADIARPISSTQLSPRSLSRPDRYIAERDPENEKEKKTDARKLDRREGLKLRGYPAAFKSLAIPGWDNGDPLSHLPASYARDVEARLNIDFGHAVGETKGEKRPGREATRGHLPISGDDSSATGFRSR